MHVTLRQLQVFEAVARLGSFSRAAEEIHVTQPAVSKQIRQLQEEVGMPLLEQVGRQVCLTDAGRELLATCSDWLDTWNRFEQSIADLKGLKQGRLRIAVVTTAKYFMPRVLGPFCTEYPGIDVTLEVINRNRLLERLGHNEDDLYVMGVPPDGWEIESQPLMENNLVVIAPRAHRLAGRRRIPFAQLADEIFIAREEGSGTRMTVERVFAENGVHFRVRMELGSNEAIKQAVAGGLGLGVLSQNTLGDLAVEGLAVLDVTGFPVRRSWYVVWPRGKQLSVVAETFVDFLHEHAALLKPRA
ncbi:MAG: LysR family transcriptional regulator [Thioalkalivibrio sp.]|nr:LysR family transcriptional regulator [Thioalkalivibrio sp.]